eukprot:167638-Pyramimonas_sp.AAC.2
MAGNWRELGTGAGTELIGPLWECTTLPVSGWSVMGIYRTYLLAGNWSRHGTDWSVVGIYPRFLRLTNQTQE